MASSKKKILRRKAAQAYQHTMRTVEIMIELRDYFGEFHTDWAMMFQALADANMVTLQTMERIFTIAWGYFPEDLNAWLK